LSNPFDYFEKVVCINRDRRPARWESARNELSKLGLDARVERFSAIEDPEDPERGCMRSHIVCVGNAAGDRAANVLIFEDDIKVYGTSEVEKAILELQQVPWQMFYLGGYPSQRRVKMPTGAKYFSPHLCRLLGGYLCGHAYAVSSSMYEFYLSKITQPIDRWWAYTVQPNTLSLVVNKLVVGQQDGFSDLRGEERSREFIRQRHARMIRKALRAHRNA